MESANFSEFWFLFLGFVSARSGSHYRRWLHGEVVRDGQGKSEGEQIKAVGKDE